jgi:hypothetical protein
MLALRQFEQLGRVGVAKAAEISLGDQGQFRALNRLKVVLAVMPGA